MSAYMVNNRTLTKIAKYMEVCANYQIGNPPGVYEIELEGGFKKVLAENGLVNKETGLFSAPLIHAFLYQKNRMALVKRYGQQAVDEEMCPEETIPMDDGGTAIDISIETREEWLSNLYTVCSCYIYQIEEGDYQDDEFFWKFNGWIGEMARVLAKYVVMKYRPNPPDPNYKPWDEF